MGVLTELYEESIEPDEFGALTLHYASKASVVEIVEMIFDRCDTSAPLQPPAQSAPCSITSHQPLPSALGPILTQNPPSL